MRTTLACQIEPSAGRMFGIGYKRQFRLALEHDRFQPVSRLSEL
jgi:hypothetical protein